MAITYGTPYYAGGFFIYSVKAISATKFIILMHNGGDYHFIVYSVSGTTFTQGIPYVIGNINNYEYVDFVVFDENTIFYSFSSNSSGEGYTDSYTALNKLTISGTTLSNAGSVQSSQTTYPDCSGAIVRYNYITKTVDNYMLWSYKNTYFSFNDPDCTSNTDSSTEKYNSSLVHQGTLYSSSSSEPPQMLRCIDIGDGRTTGEYPLEYGNVNSVPFNSAYSESSDSIGSGMVSVGGIRKVASNKMLMVGDKNTHLGLSFWNTTTNAVVTTESAFSINAKPSFDVLSATEYIAFYQVLSTMKIVYGTYDSTTNAATYTTPTDSPFAATTGTPHVIALSPTKFVLTQYSGSEYFVVGDLPALGKKINGITYAKWNGIAITKWGNQ